MTAYQTLKTPALDKRFVELLNAFSERAIAESFPFGASQVRLRLCKDAVELKADTALTFSVNGALWNVTVGEPRYLLAHPMFAKKEAFGFTPEMLPADLKCAIAEVLFTPLLKTLSEALGATVLFEDMKASPAATPALAIGWVVTLEAAHMDPLCFNVTLSTNSGASVSMLLGLLKTLPKRTTGLTDSTLQSIAWRLAVVGGSQTIAPEQLRDLSAGDILFPEQWLPSQNKVALRLMAGTQREEALCEFADGNATLASPFTPILEQNMTDTNALEVKLSFVLENRIITLGELQSMGPGYAFTLTSDPTTPVTICANDKPIARGKLVDINGAIGVQVSETL